jgi:hypothetical protein
LRNISILSGLLPIALYFCFLKRNKGTGLWVIFLYAILSFITDNTLSRIKPSEYPILKFTIFCLFTVVEYTLFTIYIYIIVKRSAFKHSIIFLSLLFLGIAIYNYYANVGRQGFDSLTASIESIFIIIFCIFFFFEQITNSSTKLIYESHKFWVIIGFLLYLSGGLFLFIYAANFSQKEINEYWVINYGVNILKNLLFCVAFALKKNELANNLFTQKNTTFN